MWIQEYKMIKSIVTKRFEIALVEMITGGYCVLYLTPAITERKGRIEPEISEQIKDFKTASFLFDEKLKDLEGN